MRHTASFLITPELIAQALHFPEGCVIGGAQWDFEARAVQLFVEGPGLPEVDEGQLVPSIMPTVHRWVAADGTTAYRWDWK